MRSMTLWQMELVPWYVFIFYWAVGFSRVKQTKIGQDPLERTAHVAAMAIAFVLLFTQSWRIGPLGSRFALESVRLQELGIVLTWLGVAVAIWARYSLGQYWSARVTLKVDHQLIRSGPYAYVRHPIYTGLLLATAGTALVVGEWRAVVAVLLTLVAFSHKARKEEALLSSEFGDQYQEYRRHTGFLAPRFR
jgi:protein-S-isoprenylcysteine O-methyltransferase Ste14